MVKETAQNTTTNQSRQLKMKIEILKNNPGYTDTIADLLFQEREHLRQGTTIEQYYNCLMIKTT